MSRKSSPAGPILVDGVEYTWQYRHGSDLEWGVGERGVSVSVWLEVDRTRELIVDFPFSTFRRQNPPKKAGLLHHLDISIRAAMAAGWIPDSRGKPFRFNAPEVG